MSPTPPVAQQPKASGSGSRAKAKPKAAVQVVVISDGEQDEILEPKTKGPSKKKATPRKTVAAAPAAQVAPPPANKEPIAAKKEPAEKKKKEKGVLSCPLFLLASRGPVFIHLAPASLTRLLLSVAAPKKKTEAVVPPSTSNTPIPDPVVPPPAPAKIKKTAAKTRPFEWEDRCKEWFAGFAEEDNPTQMDGEGIERLFEEMEVSMEGVSGCSLVEFSSFLGRSQILSSVSPRRHLSSWLSNSTRSLELLARISSPISSLPSATKSASSSFCFSPRLLTPPTFLSSSPSGSTRPPLSRPTFSQPKTPSLPNKINLADSTVSCSTLSRRKGKKVWAQKSRPLCGRSCWFPSLASLPSSSNLSRCVLIFSSALSVRWF